jgi:hypothetical protein
VYSLGAATMDSDIIELTDYQTNKIHRVHKEDVLTFSRFTKDKTEVFVARETGGWDVLVVKNSWHEIFDKVFK